MSTEAVPRLFRALVDDAAMFPPGNASAAQAVREHVGHRAAWYADVVGPLLVPHARWGEFCAAHEAAGSPEIAVVLIGSIDRPNRVPSGVTVTGFEVSATSGLDLADGSGSIAAELVDPEHHDRLLTRLATAGGSGRRVVAKYRTGGTSREAFPSEADVAKVIASAASHGVPMKFTAGLHGAVRHTDTATGFEHHGFLNVMVAVDAAQNGAGQGTLTKVLSERDPDRVLAPVHGWSEGEVERLREAFVSFGCCGVLDPVRAAVTLGLLTGEMS